MNHSTPDILRELRKTDRELPERFYEAVEESVSPELVDGLIEIMRDDSLLHDHPKKESPPVHAAELLGHLGTERALEALAEQVAAEGRATSLGETAERHLQAQDDDASRDLLVQVYHRRSNPLARKRIALCLTGFSNLDREAAELVVDQLESASGREQSELLAALASKAPPATANSIAEWFENAALAPTEIPDRDVIRRAADAIERLGGTLSRRQRRLLEETTLN